MSSLAVPLAQYLQDHHAGAFCWQRHHCGHFVGGWVQAATGRNPLAGLPAARTLRAWAAYLRRAGGFQAVVSRALHCSPVAPAWAQTGDVVLLPGEVTGGTLGICSDTYAICLGMEGEAVFLPMAQAIAAWRLREVAA